MINNNLPPIDETPYEVFPVKSKINLKLEKFYPPGSAIKFKIPTRMRKVLTDRQKQDRLLYHSDVNPLSHTLEETGLDVIKVDAAVDDKFSRTIDKTPDTP